MSKRSSKKNITQKTLTGLGLSKNEAIVYEFLLKNSNVNIKSLQKNTELSRTLLYYVLDGLQEKDLIIKNKDSGKTLYNPSSPDTLKNLLKAEETEIIVKKKVLNDNLFDLQSLYLLGQNKPNVRFFEGKKGLKEALDDSIKVGRPILSIVNKDVLAENFADLVDKFTEVRLKQGIKMDLLSVNTPFARKSYKKIGPRELTKVRYLPERFKDMFLFLLIYQDKVGILSLREGKLVAFVIEDMEVYNFYKQMFGFIWEHSIK
ncbi:MAG: hypothetical protein CO137_00535 [Candidatus Magasanikbacteria bacterium CG_4_9_14_3_um_filter_32_9]|uniref:Transcription regulator TrmB N-terminal domain-containing protein n=1 Tax=Candidatus Magasanikbacteria bacterium CG_4_9_14_3_um_filter_32_9 TaxID=1974644 RepID=A0A2M7Z7M7_9BACT|nr:MAG: hypothetical protein CO137_00535 [Candidatus Magasanikbacteria bacterium CG_4_9_14_3_um_filter_32_9]